MDNHSIIGRCLQYLRTGLSEFISCHFPDERADDVSNSLKLIAFRWNEIDADIPRKARSLAHEMIDVRNEWAHQVPFSASDTYRALDTSERLLIGIGETEWAADVAILRKNLEKPQGEAVEKRPQKVFHVQSKNVLTDSSHAGCGKKLLREIKFSADPKAESYRCLMERLISIMGRVYDRTEAKAGPIARRYIPLDFAWVNETRIEPVAFDREENLQILLHIGDTKAQGRHFYDLNPSGVAWPTNIRGYKLLVRPYIKIGDPYSRTLMWIRPNQTEAPATHSRQFFETFAGAIPRSDWTEFGDRLAQFVPDWKSKCFYRDSDEKSEWDSTVVSRNYQSIRVSVGTNLRILIPYDECVRLDDNADNCSLAIQYKKIIQEIKALVEKGLTDRLI